MKFDLCFVLVDLEGDNRDWYPAAANLMIASARQAFEGHDYRIVQLSDDQSRWATDIDLRYSQKPEITRPEFVQQRGLMTARYAIDADRPVIFCDVDILWNPQAASLLQLFETQGQDRIDITLFNREHMPSQPFNAGLVLTHPGQTEFWETYAKIMDNLPIDIRAWWGDQIAYGVMMGLPNKGQMGQIKFGSRVGYVPTKLICPSPTKQPTEVFNTPLVHFKGAKRKPWMVDYLDLILKPAA